MLGERGAHVDLVEEGFELAIRIGNLPDSSLQAKRITSIKHVLCASPEYLQTHGTPECPADLSQHAFLQYGLFNKGKIQLTDKAGKESSVVPSSRMMANNGDFLKAMATQGHGITYLPTFITYEALKTGKLVSVLNDFQLTTMGAYAVYPRSRFLPERCRMFINFLTERLGDNPYWDQ